MSAPATSSKRERLEARVTPEQKALLQRAAALEGRTVTDFMISSLQDAAQASIRRHEQIVLTTRDSARFVEALMSPAAPNERLRDAAQRHQSLLGE